MEKSRQDSTGTPDAHGQARRRLLLTLAATGGAFASANMLPRQWTRPIVDSIIVPAHAQATGPVVGLFTTAGPVASIFDLIVAPVHANGVLHNITVGNSTFDVAWDVLESSYDFCASGTLFTSNGLAIAFLASGNGGRKGNALSDITIDAPALSEGRVDGSIVLFNQLVDGSQLLFDASFQGASTSGAGAPGGECAINSTTDMRMSSPYPEKNHA